MTVGDITPRRLEDVRKYFPNDDIDIHECDVFDLPFADNEFDLVLNCLLIQHIEKAKLPDLLAELRRVTNKWIVATYPSSFSLVNAYRIFGRERQTRLTAGEFSRLAEEAGLKVVAVRSVLPLIAAGKVVLLEKID